MVEARERRTKQDFAHVVRNLINQQYPEADTLVLVLDNLNTHVWGSFYQTFPAEEARRICRKIEIHYTPIHGSWLNMAEIGLSVLARQCLRGRIANLAALQERITVWQTKRNAHPVNFQWQFQAKDARIKLQRLYPPIQV